MMLRYNLVSVDCVIVQLFCYCPCCASKEHKISVTENIMTAPMKRKRQEADSQAHHLNTKFESCSQDVACAGRHFETAICL